MYGEEGKAAYVALAALILIGMATITAASEGTLPISRGYALFASSGNTSISGTVYIEDIATTRIIGEGMAPPGGELGFHGNIVDAGDGTKDVQVWARHHVYIGKPPLKRMYTIRTEGERLPEEIILGPDTPYELLRLNENPAPDIAYGDIDGNGIIDKITAWEGYPDLYDPKRTGNLMIEFDQANRTTRTVSINGTDPLDDLGSCLQVVDIDGDGKDDIIVGAAEADGTANARTDCGEIFVIKGKDNATFPRSSIIDLAAEHKIEGHMGANEDVTHYDGDKIGRLFRVGDTDGDGALELIIANHMGYHIDEYGRVAEKAGWVIFYDLPALMPFRNSIKKLDFPSQRGTILGNDIGDSFGWIMDLADIDSDGFDDLMFTAPFADGKENSRPRCGEAYLLYGSGFRLEKLKIAGPGTEDNKLLCMGGATTWTLSFSDNSEDIDIERVEIHMDPAGEDITISMGVQGASLMKGSPEWVRLGSGSFDPAGSASVDIEFLWPVPLDGPFPISIHLVDTGGGRTISEFNDRFSLIKDIELHGAPLIRINGRAIEETGAHALPGADVDITGIGIRYRTVPGRSPVPGSAEMVLSSGSVQRDIKLNGDDRPFSFKAGGIDPDELEVSLSIPGMDPVDGGHPGTGSPVVISIPIDTGPPEAPSGLNLIMSPILVDGEIEHTTSIQWDADLGSGGDGGGSGVSHYLLNSHGLHKGPVMERGGLMATCFLDPDFREEGYTYIEEEMDLNWGPWGPEPNIIPPYGYSVRWHGWIVQDEDGELRFRCQGRGEIKIVLDNITVLPWTKLRDSPVSKLHQVQKDDAVPLQVYYRLKSGESRILVKLEDTQGRDLTLGNVDTRYPVSAFESSSELGSKVQAEVRAVDWTGRVSDPAGSVEWIDRGPPEFDLGNIPEWTGSCILDIDVKVTDPPFAGGAVSGIDVKSVEYRYWDPEEGGSELPPWTGDGFGMEVDPDGRSLNISLRLERKKDWTGYIQFRASDLMGNRVETEPRAFGFDLTPPEIDIMDPPTGAVIPEGDVIITARAMDRGGSGVKDGSVEIRWNTPEGNWTDWSPMEEELEDGRITGVFTVGMTGGTHEVQARCRDNVGREGFSESIMMSIVERKVNTPPVPVIRMPLNGTGFEWNDPIELDATGTRDDGLGPSGTLILTWFSNISGPIARGGTARVYLEKGLHRITLFADDGDYNVSTGVDILVSVETGPSDDDETPDDDIDVEDDGPYWWFFLAVIIVMVAVLMMMALVKLVEKKRSEAVSETAEDGDLDDDISGNRGGSL